MLNSDIRIKTENFDGPLGLLLLLIQKEEMSIRDLNINKITHQYIDYLDHMQELNFNVAGDYLYMASTLVFLKSKSYVTEEEVQTLMGLTSEETPHIHSEEELKRRLQELEKFQKLGQLLWAFPKTGHEIFNKPKVNRKKILKTINNPMDLQELTNIMIDMIKRQNRKYKVVKRDRLSIKEKLKFLKFFLKEGIPTTFFEILEKDGKFKKDNKVITFISLLELARLKKIGIYQQKEFENIHIEVKESLDRFNVELADGFDEENSEAPQVEAEMLVPKPTEGEEPQVQAEQLN